jgi:hypothetical protein
MSTEQEGARVNRAEWGVILSLLLNAAIIVFSAGVIWTTVQQHSADIADLRGKSDDQAEKLTRIDANVTFLAERAREDRENQLRGR